MHEGIVMRDRVWQHPAALMLCWAVPLFISSQPLRAADEPATADHAVAGDHAADGEAHVEADAHDEADHSEADAHGGGHAATGVPLDFKRDLALWSLVVFLLFLMILKKFAWGPLSKGLDKRESRIRQDLADAETAREKSAQLLADHELKLSKVQDEVREILAEARRDADHTKQEIVTEAQKEAEKTKQRAVDDIERARDSALKDLFDAAAEQVIGATEQVLARSLSDDDQNRLIDEALSQFRQN